MMEEFVTKNGATSDKFMDELIHSKKQYKILTKEEERELIEKTTDRDELNKLLVLHNIRLVFNIARKYRTKSRDYDEMVQNGMLGLITAASRFDTTKKIKFCTYAQPWVFKYVVSEFYNKQTAIDNNSTSINEFVYSNSAEGDRTIENSLNGKIAPDYSCNDFDTSDQLSADDCGNLYRELSSFVKTSSRFDDLDKTIYDALYVKGMKAASVSSTFDIDIKIVNQRKAHLLSSMKDYLTTKNITSVKEVI